MVVAVAEMVRQRRREPDFSALRRLINDAVRVYAEQHGVILTDRQLGLKLDYSEATIHGIFAKGNRPTRELLIALADLFHQSREEWQQAGGYDVDSLPWGRGWRTDERVLTEWYASLTEEEKARALGEARARHADHAATDGDQGLP